MREMRGGPIFRDCSRMPLPRPPREQRRTKLIKMKLLTRTTSLERLLMSTTKPFELGMEQSILEKRRLTTGIEKSPS